MIDCSRNGVLKVKSVQQLLCYMAMMGLNMLQLYTEDTYEVRHPIALIFLLRTMDPLTLSTSSPLDRR